MQVKPVSNANRPTILLATTNAGKAREFNELLREAPARFPGLKDLNITQDVEETGATFAENALLKAVTYAKLSGVWTLAEDSGIEVDALNGAPGVYSRRFASPNATDEENVTLLLQKMKGVSWGNRSARFRSAISIASPEGQHWTVEGILDGIVTTARHGAGGFGYDPIFWLPDRGKTTAELSMAEKNQVSHRGKAAAQAVKLLQRLVLEGVLH
ncbi:MAG: RdgB/HAM1 family non-canonical purine NTP pyrophosphatase [Dehalococcoidia bacterium]|nr:RdgB/HAM1 family non-canonical purine NTP pyrophosphatase [Dehalococcoidia bacterium]